MSVESGIGFSMNGDSPHTFYNGHEHDRLPVGTWDTVQGLRDPEIAAKVDAMDAHVAEIIEAERRIAEAQRIWDAVVGGYDKVLDSLPEPDLVDGVTEWLAATDTETPFDDLPDPDQKTGNSELARAIVVVHEKTPSEIDWDLARSGMISEVERLNGSIKPGLDSKKIHLELALVADLVVRQARKRVYGTDDLPEHPLAEELVERPSVSA